MSNVESVHNTNMSYVRCWICNKWKKLEKIHKVYMSDGICKKCHKNNVTFGRDTGENNNS